MASRRLLQVRVDPAGNQLIGSCRSWELHHNRYRKLERSKPCVHECEPSEHSGDDPGDDDDHRSKDRKLVRSKELVQELARSRLLELVRSSCYDEHAGGL